jgi:UDP-N-acetylmuramoyl-tripeptide--D-alanyl-D-alanine ligase
MRLGEILKILGVDAAPSGTEPIDREPLGYSIDSRSLKGADLFFAIRGERFDGHDFVVDALNKGAMGAVVSRDFELPDHAKSGLLIRVDDPLAALQGLASATLRSWRGREVAITGSAGKTSTKEMTAAALESIGPVAKTVGNLNNEFGLPLSILKMESDSKNASDFEFAVFEMGMNHKGEIARLAAMAPPDFGVVTVVAPVHLEFFSSIEEIADAKAELILGVKPGGGAALNADDELVARMRELRTDINFYGFGIERKADVRALDVRERGLAGTDFVLETPEGRVDVSLHLAGRHNVYNALAAATVAWSFAVPLELIAAQLAGLTSPKMRGEVLRLHGGITVVDDSYNSNPRALLEMARTASASPGFSRRVIVAGEMLELGTSGAELHRQTGRQLAHLDIDLLIGVRGLAEELVKGAREAGMSEEKLAFCETPEAAAELVTQRAKAGDLILVKGSRGVKTEIVVGRLKERIHG